MNRKLIGIAVSGCFQQATATGTDTGGNAPSTETIEAMPNSARNPSGPVGRNWSAYGAEWAGKILQAEQGVVAAGETLQSTKLDGLKEAAKMRTPEDKSGFLSGLDTAFIAADGGKRKSKTHQNYMADVRRIMAAVENNSLEFVMDILDGQGTYQQKMEKVPKTNDGRGGQNRGTGARAALQAAQQAHAEGVNVPEALKNAPNVPSQPERSTTELVGYINTCHESQLPDIWLALAQRSASKATASPLLRELGNAVLLKLQQAEGNAPETGATQQSQELQQVANA